MKSGSIKRRRSSVGGSSSKKRKFARGRKRGAKKAATARQFVTDQFDVRVDYVASKRKSNRKMKAEKAFAARVQKALTPTLPTFSKIYQVTETTAAITAGTGQGYLIFHMRPLNGTAVANIEPAQGELFDMSSELSTTGVGAPNQSGDYFIKSSVMNIDVEMTGNTDAIVDVYEIVYQKKFTDPTETFASFNAMIT